MYVIQTKCCNMAKRFLMILAEAKIASDVQQDQIGNKGIKNKNRNGLWKY